MNYQKKNFFVYFSVYLIAQIMYIYVNAYLPIYFKYASAVNISDLGLFLFASYSFMLAKPIFAIFLDKLSKNDKVSNKLFNMKLLLLLGVTGAILSFIIFILSVELLIIFTFFLGLNFTFISLMDVVIDKKILQSSTNEVLKNKTAFSLQFGAVIGAIIPNVYYFFIMDDRTSMTPWRLFFFVGIITTILIYPTIFMFKDFKIVKNKTRNMNLNPTSTKLKNVLLMSMFVFLTYGTYLYEWVLEPWAVGRLGSDSLFAIFMIIFICFDVISLIIAGKFARKYNKKTILILSVMFSGILTTIAPFLGIYLFFILITIVQLISGFYLISLTTSLFTISHDKVLIYQIMTAFSILAKLFLAPLGLELYLSSFFTGECIITIAAIIQILSIIPLLFIKDLS